MIRVRACGLVTGGGRGIGRAIALRFAADGARVGVLARSGVELEQTVEIIRELEARPWRSADVADYAAVVNAHQAVVDRLGDEGLLRNRLPIMRRRWFAVEPVEEGFLDNAPFRLAETFDIPRAAAEVWQDLTVDDPLSWCRLLREISWTSPRSFGVGTTRTARTVGNLSVINERFFRWEEGRRQSFYAVESSVPGIRRWAEDYLVESTSQTSCRFTWTIAIDPHAAARLANPVNRLMLSTLFRDTRRHYGLG